MPYSPLEIVSVALGQPHEPACIVQMLREGSRYEIRSIDQLPGRTPYEEVVELVGMKKGKLLVDITACGRPLVPLMHRAGLRPTPIVIGEQHGVKPGQKALHVPKRDLVSSLRIVMDQQRLKISAESPPREVIGKELAGFRVESERDELVRAMALGVWWAETHLKKDRTESGPRPLEFRPPTFNELMKQAEGRRSLARRPF